MGDKGQVFKVGANREVGVQGEQQVLSAAEELQCSFLVRREAFEVGVSRVMTRNRGMCWILHQNCWKGKRPG